MKISVPAAEDLPEPVQFLARDERTVLVKYLNRASGSLVGERESNREKVWRTGMGTGMSRIAPG